MAGQGQAMRWSWTVGEYMVGQQLGRGSFAAVWHGKHRVNGTEVAIKEIDTLRLNNKFLDNLMSEISILMRLNHPNIVALYQVIQGPGKIYLVLEYCNGGDLSSYIKRYGRVNEATAKDFMQQLAAGLQVLHNNNVIHRDLKPENLLLSRNNYEKLVLKIADFGLARSLGPWSQAGTICGTLDYMAPEVKHQQPYDAKADLWSVGVILFELVTGRPFTPNRGMLFPPYNPSLSFECNDLCQKLLHPDPDQRLTYEGFFNHPFLSRRRLEWNDRTIEVCRRSWFNRA